MLIQLLAGLSLTTLCLSASDPGQWAQNSVALLATPLAPDSEVWSMLTDSCNEKKDNTSALGVDCMSDAIYTLLHIATSQDGTISKAADIKNDTVAEKRSLDIAGAPLLKLRSISKGPDTVPGSTASTYSKRSTMYEHISNGTHGSIRSIERLDNDESNSRAKRRFGRDTSSTFSYGEHVKGLKLSYSTGCTFTRFTEDSLASLRYLAYNLANAASTTIHSDKYALEIFNPFDKSINHMLATLIAEVDGYENNYEEFPVIPKYQMTTEC